MTERVKVRYMGLARNTTGIPGEEVVLPEGSTVRDLLVLLQQRHGDNFTYSLFTPGGQLRPLTRVYVDEQEIEQLKGLDSLLGPEPEVSILIEVYPSGGG